jgi:hypothetical protein
MVNKALLGLTMLMISLASLLTATIIVTREYETSISTYNPHTLSAHLSITEVPYIYIETLDLVVTHDYGYAYYIINYISQTSLASLGITNSLNSETQQLMNQLQQLSDLVNESTYYLYTYKLNESRTLAEDALGISNDAVHTLSTIQYNLESLNYLLTMLGYIDSGETVLTPITARLVQITPTSLNNTLYMTINRTVTELYDEILNYKNESLRVIILSQQEAMKYKPIPTRLIVNVSSYYTTPGSTVLVSGRLTMRNGTGIGNALINIYYLYEGLHELASAVTDKQGYFSVNVTIPQVYVGRLPIMVSYTPPPGSYYEGSTTFLVMGILYVNTTYLVSIPTQVIWGQQLNITGWINGPGGREVVVLINGINHTATTNNDGYFNISISTANLSPGNYTLVMHIMPKGQYAPANAMLYLSIMAFKPSISIEVSKYVIAGLPLNFAVNIHVNTTVTSQWVLTAMIDGEEVMKSFSGTAVRGSIKLPITLWMNYYGLTIYVAPNPPYSGYETMIRLFVINPLELAIIIFIITATPIMVITKAPSEREGVTTHRSVSIPGVKLMVMELKNIRERLRGEALIIYDMYVDILNRLLEKYKLKPSESSTLREIMTLLGKYMDYERYGAFMKATMDIERIIYANYTPTGYDIQEFQKLRDFISEGL